MRISVGRGRHDIGSLLKVFVRNETLADRATEAIEMCTAAKIACESANVAGSLLEGRKPSKLLRPAVSCRSLFRHRSGDPVDRRETGTDVLLPMPDNYLIDVKSGVSMN